ncbi:MULTISPECIES: fumarylacetoacetate hydrolase family protein [Acidithrix]|uniref:Ureidoglycolate lyase n=1 Tax=Acidithrix ferrooxidans TaxID=1280514 RepID=A0A0D8HLY8_9ACTN|nr:MULTISPECIES: fumarylacetoacetate hydrolase family protein [Acidithrix]KJF18844.1 ureidoglycolate lyase [Acidithrix ferrooxidans]
MMERLATIWVQDGTRAIAVREDDSFYFCDFDDVGAILRSEVEIDEVISRARQGQLNEGLDPSALAPLVLDPTKVICLGLNYSAHVQEMGHELPKYPTLFAKYSDSLTGAYSDIAIPAITTSIDYEAEMVIVIGKSAKDIDPSRSFEYVAGFCVGNDTSIRDFQRRSSQFLQGKIFESATPVGPYLTPAKDVDFGKDLSIRSFINGEVAQDSRTSNLIFGVEEIVSYISRFVTLRPGDLIFTGTPDGVGAGKNPPAFLSDGDVVSVEIEGLGRLSNTIVQ